MLPHVIRIRSGIALFLKSARLRDTHSTPFSLSLHLQSVTLSVNRSTSGATTMARSLFSPSAIFEPRPSLSSPKLGASLSINSNSSSSKVQVWQLKLKRRLELRRNLIEFSPSIHWRPD